MQNGRHWALLGIAAGATILAGYYIYNVASCDGRDASKEVQTIKVTPFHNNVGWDLTQEEKEIKSRTWMEKYVRTVLLKSQDALDSSTHSPPNTKSRESLRRVIANEKGLLKLDDFEHLQKIIHVHSKSLLCSMRLQHREERSELYEAAQWTNY
jgi:hypothetical protein